MHPADPKAPPNALAALVAPAGVGAALIAGRSWYSEPVASWLLEEPALTQSRGRLLLLGARALLVMPLAFFALYLWRLGSRVIASREFPPPGALMLRDTEVVGGHAAIAYGRALRALAVFLVVASLGLALAVWRVALLLTDRS